eukprot:6635471-Pyramimonas_sp.AAC.1
MEFWEVDEHEVCDLFKTSPALACPAPAQTPLWSHQIASLAWRSAVRRNSSPTCFFYLSCARKCPGVHQRCVTRGCDGVDGRCGVHRRCGARKRCGVDKRCVAHGCCGVHVRCG